MNSRLSSTVFLSVVILVSNVYTQSLFPPVDFTKNFALRQPSTATSTCGICEMGEPGCALCNSSCPYEQQVPEPMDLLEVGTLASGVAHTNMTSVDGFPIYEFSGNEESYVSLPDLSFQPSQGFTFTAWVQQDQGNNGYVFAKTTESGITSFYALYLDSEGQSAVFEYRPESLEEGFRTIILTDVNLADDRFHHIAVSVYGSGFALYVDGQLHRSPQMLIATLEDGLGVLFLGRRQAHLSRFSGLMHSMFYFNSTLSDSYIATLAAVVSDPLIQPECQCPPTHSIVLDHECQNLLGTSRIPRINLASHDAANINDGDRMTWWQSSNGEAPVNVTVGLGGLRAALLVVMQFNSLLPRAMVLYYSTDGNLFYPRQYYAADCSNFSLPDNGPLRLSTDVNCVTSNSLPLENQSVEFRVLDMGNRPGVEDYFMPVNSDLQVFAQATHIRLELLAWNTDVLADQHFAVNEVMVYGQACVCNGHATMCNGATCICEQNTTGMHCEDCVEGYFKYSPQVCRICQCNTAGTIGSSNLCNRVTGQCPCKPNVVGLDCSLCAPGYYGDGGNASCLPCDDQCLECTGPGLTNCVTNISQPESTSELIAMLGTSVLDIATSFIFLGTTTIASSETSDILQPFSEVLSTIPSSDGLTPGPSTVPMLLTFTDVQPPHTSQTAITSLAIPSHIPPLDSSINFLLSHASTTPETFAPSQLTSVSYPDLLPESSSEIVMKLTELPTSSPLQVSAFFQTMFIPTSQYVELTPTFTQISSLSQTPSGLLLPNIKELSTRSTQPVIKTRFILPTGADEVFTSTSIPEIQLTMTPQLSLISETTLQPSTELLLSAHPSVTLTLPIVSPMTSSLVTTQETSTILRPSTALLTSEELPSTMPPVTLQPSVLIPTVASSSDPPNMLLPLPSSELLTLSETFLPPTSIFVLDESSLPLELFPSIILPEIQPTSTIPQTTLSEMHMIVTSSDIIELTVSPQPSEVTLSVSQLLATQSLSLFPKSAITPMLSEQVSPIPTLSPPLPLLTPSFLSLTSPMEPSSPPPAPLSSSLVLFPFTSFLITPQLPSNTLVEATSVPAVIATEVTGPVPSLHMASQSSTPVKSSPTTVMKTIVPISAAGPPLPTLAPTLVPFTCPPSVQVSSTEDSLVSIVLALTDTEHSELALDRSARQCRLEEALVVVFEMGLQVLEEGSQGRKKRQLQDNENYAARIIQVGPHSSNQSTIIFYIINITVALPLPAVDVLQAFQAVNIQEIDTYQILSITSVGISPSTSLQLETSTTLLFPLPSTMLEPLVSIPTGDMVLSISELILQPSTELLRSAHPSVSLIPPIASPTTSSPITAPIFQATGTILQPSTALLTSEELPSTMPPVTLQPSVLIPTVASSSDAPNMLLPLPSSELLTLSETFLLPTSIFVLDESSLPLELFPSIFLPEIQPTSTIPQTTLSEMHVIVTRSDILELMVSPQPSEITSSLSQVQTTQSLSLFPEVATEILPESAMSPMFSEQVSPIPTPLPPLTPLFLSPTTPMEPSSPPPAPLSTPLILFPFTSFLITPQILSTSQVQITSLTSPQLETSPTLLFPLPSTMLEPLVSIPTGDMVLSISELILQPSTELLRSAHPSVSLIPPIASPTTSSLITAPTFQATGTILQPSTALLTSEELPSTMPPVTLQPSVLIPTVATSSESPNSLERLTLSETSFLLPTSVLVLDENSLPLELFPSSFLPEIQPTVTSIIPQTTLNLIVTHSDITELTVSPQPSEVTLSLPTTQYLSLFLEVTTEIVPSLMFSNKVSPIPTAFPPLPPITSLFLSLTSPSSPLPAPLLSPLSLFPFTSFLLSPQILSTSPVGISPSISLQLETSTTFLFPLPSTMLEPPVSSPDIALSISEFILQPSTELLLSEHPNVTLMLPTASPVTSSQATTSIFQATSIVLQPSPALPTSEELPTTMLPVTLQPSVLIPIIENSSESPNMLLPLPSSELPILSETLLPTSVFALDESSLPLELFPSSFLPPTVTSIIPQTTLSEMHVIVTRSDITELTVSPQPSEATPIVSQLMATQSSSLFLEVATEIVPESAMLPMFSERIATPFRTLLSPTQSFLSLTPPMKPSSPPPAPLLSPFPFTSFLITSQILSTSLVEITPSTTQPIFQLENSTTLLLPLLSMIEPQTSSFSILTSVFMFDDISSSLELFPSPTLLNIQPTLTSTIFQQSRSEPPLTVTNSIATELTISISEIALFSSDIISLPLESFVPEATAEMVPESTISPPSPISSLESQITTSNITLLSPSVIAMTASFLIPSPTLEGLLSETSFLFSTSATMFDETSLPLELVPSTSLPEMQLTISSSIPQLTENGTVELTVSMSEIVLQQPESLLFVEVTTGLLPGTTNLLQISEQPSSTPTPSLPFLSRMPSLFSITSTLEPFSLSLPTPSSQTLTLFLSTSSFEDTASHERSPMPSSDLALPESSSELVIPNLTPAIPISTVQVTSAEVAILSSMIQTVSTPALTGVPSPFSQPSSSELRSHVQLPTSSGIAQVISSVTRHTSVPVVMSTEIPGPVPSLLMTSQSSAPVKSQPRSIIETTLPISAAGSPLPTPAPMSVPFTCPSPLQVSSTVNSLVNIVLALTFTEHLELALDRSARQCRLEEALVVVFEMGLQVLWEGNQGNKKRQLRDNENYGGRIIEVGPLSSGQSTITFYIINITDALPLTAVAVVLAFWAANQQEIDTYPVIHQPFAHTMEGTEPTLIPIVAGVGGSVLLVLLLVVAIMCVGLLVRFRNRRKDKYTPRDPGGEAGTIPTDDFVVHHIDNQHRPSHDISIGEPSHSGIVRSASETTDSQVPAECVAHYDTSQASPFMQPRFREIVAPPPSSTHEGSQEEYADGGGYSGSVQGQKLYDDVGRIQEDRYKQELKARRKATYNRYKYGPGGRRIRKKAGLRMQDTAKLPHSWERRKLTFEDTDAPFPSATPPFGLPGSPHRTTTHPFTRLNRVGVLATPQGVSHRLSRNQHGCEEPFSRLSTTGRLPRGIARGVQQELTWMETGSGVQLLRVQPILKQQPHRAHPLPVWEPREPFLYETHATPESTSHSYWENGRRLGTSGGAERPPEASPDTSDSVQDLIQEAFSISPALAHPSGGSSGRHQQQTSTAMSLKEQSALPQQQEFTQSTSAVAQQRSASLQSHAASPAHTHLQYTSQDLMREAFSIPPALAHPSGGSSGGHHQRTSTAMSLKERSALPQQQAFTHVAWQSPTSLPRHAARPLHAHPQQQPVDCTEDMGQLVWTPPSSAQTHLRSPPPILGLQSYPNPLNTPFYDHEPQSHPVHTP